MDLPKYAIRARPVVIFKKKANSISTDSRYSAIRIKIEEMPRQRAYIKYYFAYRIEPLPNEPIDIYDFIISESSIQNTLTPKKNRSIVGSN